MPLYPFRPLRVSFAQSLFRYALGGATAAAKKFEKKPDFGSKKGGRSSDAPQSVAKPKRASKTAKKYRVSPVERSAGQRLLNSHFSRSRILREVFWERVETGVRGSRVDDGECSGGPT